MFNTDLHHGRDARIVAIDDATFAAREVTPGSDGTGIAAGESFRLAPGAARIFVNY